MTTRHLVVLIAVVTLCACGRSTQQAPQPTGEAFESTAAETHTEEANTVEIDEGMLRDLRITTSAVESRPGGERVVLLGALAVDEGAYAEVSAPIAARVNRLLVNAGDSVRRGQTLAELTSPDLGRERAE